MAALDILDLLKKVSAGSLQSGSTSLETPETGLSADLGAALEAAKSTSFDTDQTTQLEVGTPTIDFTPSQYINAGLIAAKGIMGMGNPITLLSAANSLNNLATDQRGKLGQWFDSLFGYATDEEIADLTGSMGYIAPNSAEEEAAMQELSQEDLDAILESKLTGNNLVAGSAQAESLDDLGFQNPDQTGWETTTLGWETPSAPTSDDTSSSDWSWDWGSFFGEDTASEDDGSTGPGTSAT